jgi:HK97 family phage portal protein
MGLLSRFIGGGLHAQDYGPTSDYWYGPVGQPTAAGFPIDHESAQKISAWYRGRDILATVLAMLPVNVMERLPNDGGAEVASQHPLQDLIHDAPNESIDSFQWRRQKMYDLIDGGWTYDWIRSGRRGFVHELQPICAHLVTPKRIISGEYAGRYVFDVRDEQTGRTTPHTEDEIFHLRGAEGKGILQRARESLGIAMAVENYAASTFGKGTLNSGVIENPGVLDPAASRRMAVTFLTKPGEGHLPKVLEQGSKWVPNNMSPEDAQMLLSRKHSVDDVARWLGLSRMMLENSDPSFGNAEQFWQLFLAIGIGPWLAMWEFGSNRQLLLDQRKYFVRFNRDAIVRGDIAARWRAHVEAVNAGIKSVDEVRSVEDLNRRGGKADELREPQNITGKPLAPEPDEPAPPAKKKDTKDEAFKRTRAEAIVVGEASRILRTECAFVKKAAIAHASDGKAFAAAVSEFYAGGHPGFVSRTLRLTLEQAKGYCADQAHQVIHGDWVASVESWATEAYAVGLAAMALEEAA